MYEYIALLCNIQKENLQWDFYIFYRDSTADERGEGTAKDTPRLETTNCVIKHYKSSFSGSIKIISSPSKSSS